MNAASILTWLKLPSSQEPFVEEALRRALAVVEKDVDWYFGPPRPVVELISGTGSDVLFLRQPPVSGFPVTVQDRHGLGHDWVDLDGITYELDGRRLLSAGRWPRGTRNIRVGYHEGFVEVPLDIQDAVISMVANRVRQRGKEGITSESIGDYSYNLSDAKAADGWTHVQANWRRGRI